MNKEKYFNIILSYLDKKILIDEITKDFYLNNLKEEYTLFSKCFRLKQNEANDLISNLITLQNYKIDLEV